jgi:hypothetical protein
MRRTAFASAGAALAAAVLVLSAVVALGSIPDNTGTIYGCYSKTTGMVRVIDQDAGATCRRSEKELNWNEQGPPGPSQLFVSLREEARTITVPPNTPEGVGVASACLAGEVVVGGGITARTAGLEQLTMLSVGPFFDGSRSGWGVDWYNDTSAPVTVQVTIGAECVPGTMTVAQ